MKTFLDVLDDRIQAISKTPCFVQAPAGCADPDVMSLCLAAIQQYRGTTHHFRSPKGGTVRDAVLYFRETGTFRNYREGRYVCVGASLDVSGWCLLGDPELLKKLLFWCRVSVIHQGLRFYSCLLHSVRSFPGNREEIASAWKAGWFVLRDWLDDYRSNLTLALPFKPHWFFTLNENINPLRDLPIQRDARCLLEARSAAPHLIATDHRSASDSRRHIEANPETAQTNGERDSDKSPSCLPSLEDPVNLGPESGSAGAISARWLTVLPWSLETSSYRSERILSRGAAVSPLSGVREDRPACHLLALESDVVVDNLLRMKVGTTIKTRFSRHISESLSAHVKESNQRLDFLFGFAAAIEELGGTLPP